MKFTTQIEHVVVLMMENHSFDNMLGWLPGIGELTGSEANEYKGCTYTTCARPRTFTTRPGPNHDFANVNLQVLGTEYPSTGTSPLDLKPLVTMSGFVEDYIEKLNGPGDYVMACYLPEQVPVISLLAQTFQVCRRWFCSVPGPTGPNRIYANCASSAGYAGANFQATLDSTKGCSGMMPWEMGALKSIFGVLADHGCSWGVFHEDPVTSKDPYFSTELILSEVRAHPEWVKKDPGFKKFHAHIQSGNLPNYSFLTPNLWQNSQHPSDDLRFGECVMANIYEMIANSSYWDKTLFILTYDEHGGFYDSVPTPTGVPNPDGPNCNWDTTAPADYHFEGPSFYFDRLGVRVPAILISPYVQAKVDDTQYEHSSIPATVLELFGLTWPVENARIKGPNKVNTFTSAIGGTLRKDIPLVLPRPAVGGGDYVPLPRPLLPG